MWWFDYILQYLASVRDYFLNAYYTVNGWIAPFNLLATPLYWLYIAFHYLTGYFSYFSTWVYDANTKLGQILSISAITSYFQTWINYATAAWDWVYRHYNNVVSDVTTWWSASNNPIKLYIAQAIAAIGTLPDWLVNEFNKLKTAWDGFWSSTWPQWIATVSSNWNSFLAFVAGIGQTILSHLNAWWDSTIFPALESIWQFLSSLNIPTWEEIWEFIFSHVPWLAEILDWWNDVRVRLGTFFEDPVGYIKALLSWTWLGDLFWYWVGQMLESPERIEQMKEEAPELVPTLDETHQAIKDPVLGAATLQYGVIEETLAKIKGVLVL